MPSFLPDLAAENRRLRELLAQATTLLQEAAR